MSVFKTKGIHWLVNGIASDYQMKKKIRISVVILLNYLNKIISEINNATDEIYEITNDRLFSDQWIVKNWNWVR